MDAEQEAKILVVDDDPMLCRQLELYLNNLGRSCTIARTLQEGVECARQETFDVIFLDVNLPDSSGLESIESFKATASKPEVIIITSDSDPDGAELAVRNGAWYYMEKPLAFNAIKLIVGRVLQFRQHRSAALQFLVQRSELVGQDPKFLACLSNVALAARSGGNVLITGETGTGKELVARAIHANSSRAGKPFVIVDCTSIPETLAESLLFGHERGAFTDARERRLGMVPQADKGTLFLDEVGELPLDLQRTLLRVIQEKSYRLLGDVQEYGVDLRFVAATNRDIATMVDQELFRKDLFYRLATFHIKVPPLRERSSDIRLLVRHFLDDICQEQGVPYKGVSGDFIDALSGYHWPGNVRELFNVLFGSVAMAGPEPVLYPHHLPTEFKAQFFRRSMSAPAAPRAGQVAKVENDLEDRLATRQEKPLGGQTPARATECAFDLDFDTDAEGGVSLPPLKEFREKYYTILESQYLEWLITAAEGDAKRACELAGVSRSRLYQLLDKHGRKLQ